jgi:hypothetical protein
MGDQIQICLDKKCQIYNIFICLFLFDFYMICICFGVGLYAIYDIKKDYQPFLNADFARFDFHSFLDHHSRNGFSG